MSQSLLLSNFLLIEGSQVEGRRRVKSIYISCVLKKDSNLAKAQQTQASQLNWLAVAHIWPGILRLSNGNSKFELLPDFCLCSVQAFACNKQKNMTWPNRTPHCLCTHRSTETCRCHSNWCTVPKSQTAILNEGSILERRCARLKGCNIRRAVSLSAQPHAAARVQTWLVVVPNLGGTPKRTRRRTWFAVSKSTRKSRTKRKLKKGFRGARIMLISVL